MISKMKLDLWEKQQLEKMINGSIKATRAQIKQFESKNQLEQAKSIKSRLQKYERLQDKIKSV